MKLGIILTGTVEPAVKGGHFSPVERMQMYTQALEFYAKELQKTIPIFFVENSNADLSIWEKQFQNRLDLTVMQFRPDSDNYKEFDITKGKGYNEYLMIKKCITEITKACHSQNITHFLKITGRYSMLNIKKIIREIENRVAGSDTVFMGDIKDTRTYEILKMSNLGHWGESRFFMAEIDFYREHLIDCYKEMNDYEPEKWAEYYMLRLSREYRKDKRFVFRYRTQVHFNGVSGDASQTEQDSLKYRIRTYVRQFVRYMFPFWWI